MNREQLKLGEIYVSGDYIFKYTSQKSNNITLRPYPQAFWYSFGGTIGLCLTEPFIEATDEEKHWINKCIEYQKFIPLTEALKDLYILPEKWCVEGIHKISDSDRKNSLECKYLNSFCEIKNYGFFKDTYYWIEDTEVNHEDIIPHDRTLITIDQFRQYIKSQNNTPKVEKTKTFTIEQIEQILKDNYDGDDLDDLIKIFKKQLL